MEKRVGFWSASRLLLLGVAAGAVAGSAFNVFVLENFDTKFADARIIPLTFDFLLLFILTSLFTELSLIVAWPFAGSSLRQIPRWHYASVGVAFSLLVTLLLIVILP